MFHYHSDADFLSCAMTIDDPLVRALVRLLSSSGRVPTAEFSASERSALVQFSRSHGGLRLVMVGRKSDYAITNRAALESHVNQLQPGAWVPQPVAAAPKAAIETAATTGGICYLLLKAVSPDARWGDSSSSEARTFMLAELQQATGVVALALQNEDGWHTKGLLWIVEQQSQFDQPDWLPKDATGTLAYCAAPMRPTLQQWLAHSRRAAEVRRISPNLA